MPRITPGPGCPMLPLHADMEPVGARCYHRAVPACATGTPHPGQVR